MTKLKTAIGLMSGTSMDGIDAALLATDGQKHLQIIGHHSHSYSATFRQKLKAGLKNAQYIINRQERPGNLPQLEKELTLEHAAVVETLLAKLGYDKAVVDLIGFHGQTLLHRPEKRLTVQIGDGALLARATGIDVVYDMRANDMAHGGQGAPLTPAYHAVLAGQIRDKAAFPLAFVNIGGISNLTRIDKDGQIAAFDCGPGNCLIDQWMELCTGKPFDRDGAAGLRGRVIDSICKRYLDSAWWQKGLSSFDWRDFTPLDKNSASVEDGAATLGAVTAASIIHALEYHFEGTKTLVVSGGGVKNQAVMQQLRRCATLRNMTVHTADDFGFDAGFIEAEAWGYLAVRAFYGLPLTWPATTGCTEPVSGGVLTQALGA
ncbi:MAG: Anhydro-N-acetylmuramic acid kinase [Candidatus Tokpelaia hoelldobleri]|uniref:Anhydro-N-acetylmuramic acid kinase n=1 Tax=Candidatus Tokpelaia hoelldobleri TaxID=1902579 RepID=A0A1U9JUV1_9HYPH|nr:MAG: Anhydro-N-acetylmuramic acid kinase [Candidatus Tokpelaia hoelldoblerii]